jgi:photosystem II stability/assembly factor-like uncharacterized protein
MKRDDAILTLTRRDLRWLLLLLVVVILMLAGPHLGAQKVQDAFGDTFKIATDDGGIAIAASADGRHVYLVGKRGLVVSDDYGKTGSWVQTLRMK